MDDLIRLALIRSNRRKTKNLNSKEKWHMIRVGGSFRVTGGYEVELDMTEEEFDALSERQQTELLDGAIDWRDALESSETDEIEVWDLEEVE